MLVEYSLTYFFPITSQASHIEQQNHYKYLTNYIQAVFWHLIVPFENGEKIRDCWPGGFCFLAKKLPEVEEDLLRALAAHRGYYLEEYNSAVGTDAFPVTKDIKNMFLKTKRDETHN